MRILAAVLLTFACAAPLRAQTTRRPAAPKEPAVTLRPFFLAAGEYMAASQTFEAVLGEQSLRPFWGGGVQVSLRGGVFFEIAVSRFSATGERLFVSNGRVFPLGIPLTATITPIEFTGGYRFKVSKSLSPYVAAGVGHFTYSESSDFDEADDEVSVSDVGVVAMGGVEIRFHRWVAVGIDAEYAHVPGILGNGGVSKAFGEDDLGGTALRVKILVGR